MGVSTILFGLIFLDPDVVESLYHLCYFLNVVLSMIFSIGLCHMYEFAINSVTSNFNSDFMFEIRKKFNHLIQSNYYFTNNFTYI